MKDLSCAYKDTSKGFVERQNLEVDYNTFNSKLIGIPLVGIYTPTRILNNIYFPNDENMLDKEIIGINIVDSSFLPTIFISNVNYTVVTAALSRKFSLSIFDRTKKAYTINYIPLATLISPATITNMKFPFHKMNVFPDMIKSFLRLNSGSGFNPALKYVVLLNVYYK